MANERYAITPHMMGRELTRVIAARFDWYKTLRVEELEENKVRFTIKFGQWSACEEIILSSEQLESSLDDLSGEVLVPLAKRFIKTMITKFNTEGDEFRP